MEKGLLDYINTEGNPFYEYERKAIAKKIAGIQQEADEAALVFADKLSEASQEESKTDMESNPWFQRAAWTQPEDAALPIRIGHAGELGMHASFTAMCWVKNNKPPVEHCHRGRSPIFMGDLNPKANGEDWED